MTLTSAGSEQQAVSTAFGYSSSSAKGGEVGKEQVSAVLDGVSERTNEEAEISVDLLRMLLNTYAAHFQPVYTTTKTPIVDNANVATSTSAVNENQTCSERNAAGGVKVTGGGGDILPQVKNLEALKVVELP
jgi:hypothetical protein